MLQAFKSPYASSQKGTLIASNSPSAFSSQTIQILLTRPSAAISRRTKEALAAAKARGVNVGNSNGAAPLRRAGKGGQVLREAVSRNADEFAAGLRPVVEALWAEGKTTLQAIAEALNELGILTRRGGRWQVSNVKGLLWRFGW